MSMNKYRFAYVDDDRDNPTPIESLSPDDYKQHKYYCVGCGQELLACAINSKNVHRYFRHKVEGVCSVETYLHKLTKHIIKKKFEEESEFLIEYEATNVCNKVGCKYRNSDCREIMYSYRIDLKKDYDTCTEEAPINGYIADILLTNSEKPDIAPILIEVCVSHPCEEEKRNSGLQIIEIKIRNEQDVIDLQKKRVLCASPRYASKREQTIEFISFKQEIQVPLRVKLQRFIYNPNHRVGTLTYIDCDKAQYKLRESDDFIELNVVNMNNFGNLDELEIRSWLSLKKGIRRCNLCKFYYKTQYERNPKCRLSKNYGTPEYPLMSQAEQCRSYIQRDYTSHYHNPDNYVIEEITSPSLSRKREYKVILAAGNDFSDYALYKKKILFYLSNKIKTHSIVVLTGASRLTDIYTKRLSEDIDFIKEPHEADRGRYGLDAIRISNEEMTASADALIAFWNGKSSGIKTMIESAKRRGIKVAIVKF